MRERTIGTDHPETAYPLYGLIKIALKQENFAEAERLTQLALDLQEQALKPQDLDRAALLFILSTLLIVQGKYDEAEPLYQQALSIQEKVLGYDHPITKQTQELPVAMLRLRSMRNEVVLLEASRLEQAKKKEK